MSEQMKDQAAFDIGQMAERIADGYYTYLAAIQIATDPRAEALSPGAQSGIIVPEGYVFRKDGTRHRFHFKYFLRQARSNPAMIDDLPRAWLVRALLTIGDALSRHDYFDHAPELALLYHMRNGVGHGNVFRFSNPGKRRLANHPAHNRLAWIKSDTNNEFEITLNLKGQPVLFDFMGPADVVDLLKSVGLYLIRIGNGDPLRP
jgi:hypothetical protein